jgi:hypothetical protein
MPVAEQNICLLFGSVQPIPLRTLVAFNSMGFVLKMRKMGSKESIDLRTER